MVRLTSLHSFRRLLRETQVPDKDIAEAVGVSSTTIYRWREGESRPPIAHRGRVLDFLLERARRDLNNCKQVRRDQKQMERLIQGP